MVDDGATSGEQVSTQQTATNNDQANNGAAVVGLGLQLDQLNVAAHNDTTTGTSQISSVTQDDDGVIPTEVRSDNSDRVTIHDTIRAELPEAVWLHIRTHVLEDHIPLLQVASNLSQEHSIDIYWLALLQIGFKLINAAADLHSIMLIYRGPSRTTQELAARTEVHKVKSMVWDVYCWRYESAANMAEVECQRAAHEKRFGQDAWNGDNNFDVYFQPFFEKVGSGSETMRHAQPFYVDFVLYPYLPGVSGREVGEEDDDLDMGDA